jgi:adenylate kinase family enzyme
MMLYFRLKTFHDCTEPVIAHYDKQGKVRRINAERSPDEVFADVVKAVEA